MVGMDLERDSVTGYDGEISCIIVESLGLGQRLFASSLVGSGRHVVWYI